MSDVEVIQLRELLDFVVLFETEPEWVHPDGWFYGAHFVTTRGEDRIEATIATDDGEFDFEWQRGGVVMASMALRPVASWRIERGYSQERLVMKLSNPHAPESESLPNAYPVRVTIHLKPQLRVAWEAPWGGFFEHD